MQERPIKRMVRGAHTVDGDGVHLTRVLGNYTMYDFDPFLMLDSFDSTNPEDYIRGFPWHPHRGIETVTYLIQGEIDHSDSLGNRGVIRGGQCQWMTAGSGILHQEMPQPAERMLGFQLWLNLPKEQKMDTPNYYSIEGQDIGIKETEAGTIRVLAGEFDGVKGAATNHIPAQIVDMELEAGSSITMETDPEETVFVFLIEGDAIVHGETVAEKTAVLFGEGDTVTLTAPDTSPSRIIIFAAKPLGEEIAWGGPIVMNTSEELAQAFRDLENGEFVLHKPSGDVDTTEWEQNGGEKPEPPLDLPEKLL